MRCSPDKIPAYNVPTDSDVLTSARDIYRDLNLTIETVAIGTVKGYARNARTHSPDQIDQIARSIETFGLVVPLTVGVDGTIIAGHARYAAAKQLGYETVPIVRISHLTDEQKACAAPGG